MNLNLPAYVIDCLETLNNSGYDAWIVGGCVRDHLLKKTPNDYDIATDATPVETIKLFNKTLNIGSKYGVVTVICENKKSVDIATFRTEDEYIDSRRPNRIEYVDSIRQDLSRRDFTVNAIAYSHKFGIADYYKGRQDIADRVIRTVGDPNVRFNEDSLRILRAFRFSSQLGFSIEDRTLQAALRHSDKLSTVSPERILSEFIKILVGKNPNVVRRLISSGGLSFLGINDNADVDLSALSKIPPDIYIRLAAFCSLLNIDPLRFCENIKADSCLSRLSNSYYVQLSKSLPGTKEEYKRRFGELRPEHWPTLLKARKELFDEDIEKDLFIAENLLQYPEPYLIKDLDINGKDLISNGFNEGKNIGIMLNKLLALVIENPSLNNNRILLELSKKIITINE